MTTPCTCVCVCAASLDQSGLPDFVAYPGPGSDWDSIPLGVTGDGGEVMWDLWDVPHALVAGPPGSGKSVAQRVVLAHALHYPAHWQVIALDPKGIELAWLRQHDTAEVHAFGAAAAGVHEVHAELEHRLAEQPEKHGRAILVVVNDADLLVKDPEVAAKIQAVAAFGRAFGMHLHVSTQDPMFLSSSLRANLGLRVAHKALTATESTALFGTDQAAALAKVHGRSYIGVGEESGPFQAYYAQAD